MTSDADSSPRKHDRSPSGEEIDKSSKRHKHRHHHRHHRRHHRSKKDGDDSKEIGDENAPSHLSSSTVTGVPVANSNRGCDDDVEEGEILDDDAQNLVDNGNGVVGSSLVGDCAYSDPEAHANGVWDLGDKHHHNEGKKSDKESSSVGNRRIISYHDIDAIEVDESKSIDLRKSSSFDSHIVRHKTRSSSRDRYRDEVRSRSRSMSRDLDRGRSHSHSVLEEEEPLKSKRRKDVYEEASDDDRMDAHTNELWHDNREQLRDVERSTSKYSRYHEGESRHYNLDVCGRDGKEGEMDKEQKRGKERDMSRDRDVRRAKEQERGRDRDDRREIEHGRSWDMDLHRETDSDLRRKRERGRSKDRLIDREKRRESTRDRSMDNEMDRERRREKLRESRDREEEQRRRTPDIREKSIDRDSERGRDRMRDRDRYRDKDRLRDRHRENEREREMEREMEREKEREMRRGTKSDKGRGIKTSKETSNSLCTGSFDDDRAKLKREEEEQGDFEERIAQKLVEQEEEDLERIKEESRKRRQAILEKYKNKRLQQQNQNEDENVEEAGDKQVETAGQLAIEANVAKDNHDLGLDGADVYVADPSFSVDKSLQQNGLQASERTAGAGGLGEGTPKSERSLENKYYDDIFGESPAGIRKSAKGDGLPVTRSGLHDNWDDAEGYYSYRFGEVLDGRYEIAAAHGKGVFSTVVRAKNLNAGIGDPEEVAVKIIRNNETMHKAGQLEVQILNKLGGADPENKRHCVCLLSSFKYRNHLCLVFESLHMNLREVLKKFGRNIGLKLTAIRAYAKQLFIALKHLKNCGVLHCDIKPDNMLVNEAKNVLKLCDFGNAMFAGKNEITPYLVSRFYRAPEIILGLPYDHPMDIWSVGCCLYELYTGKVLFPGPTNNDMLRLHMELKGPFPKKMLRKGAFVEQHFDQDLNFFATEEDPVTRKIIKRMIVNIKPKDIGTIISGSLGEDPKMLANFKDLLDKIFILDPEKRLTVHQALAHPFITGK